MKVLVYDTHSYDRTALDAANRDQHTLAYTPAQLDIQTASLADGYDAISTFVNDQASADVLARLAAGGVKLVTQRATVYNDIDLAAAHEHGITVTRVRSYSPYAVAEHAVALLMTLNRKIHRAANRTREFNFRLAGLMGRDIHGSTVGVIGTGSIGAIFAHIMRGFGCELLGYDLQPNPDCVALGMEYVPLEELLGRSDIVSLHAPLTEATQHLIDATAIAQMKQDAFLINTSRGGLVDAESLLQALTSGRLAGAALDVYEGEKGIFFRDLSDIPADDAVLARLLNLPNVIVTGHQAFFTREAVTTIAETTIGNISDFEAGRANDNTLTPT